MGDKHDRTLHRLATVVTVGLFLVALACPSTLGATPLGRVVWTELSGTGSSVRQYTFAPAEVKFPPTEERSGIFKFGTNQLTGDDDYAFLHPAFDFTGVRLFFARGKGVDAASSWPAPAAPTTKVMRFYDEDATSGSAGTPWRSFFAPAPDHQGKGFFYTRFDGGAEAGFKLCWRSMDGALDKILGPAFNGALWPAVSPDDALVAFARQLDTVRPGKGVSVSPVTMGIYVAPITDAASGAVGDPVLVTPAMYATFQGTCDGQGAADDTWAGPLRVGKPAFGPGGQSLVFPLQDCRYGTSDATWNLWKCEASGTSWSEPSCVKREPGYDEVWPSVSADGAWLVYLRRKAGDAEWKVVYSSLKPMDSPRAAPTDVVPDQPGSVSGWPCFDQDTDPPNLEIRLAPADSREPTFVKVTDLSPDHWAGGSCTDRFQLSFRGQNFEPTMSVKFSPASTMTLEWAKNTFPARLGVALTTKTETETKSQDGALRAPSYADGAVFTPVGGSVQDYQTVGGKPLQAFFIGQNVRLRIGALARDNRFHRRSSGTPSQMDPAVFDWASEEASYDREVAGGTGERNASPPYFPRQSRQFFEPGSERRPGVAWWIEDGEGQIVPGTDGAPDYLFRIPNYPPPTYAAFAANKPYRLHVVAQDLLLNQVEVVLPIYVVAASMRVRGMEFDSTRQK